MMGLAYGLGVDSSAIIVGMVARGIRPDFILFADVGAEKDSTYAYLPIMQNYLAENNMPLVQVVRNMAPKSPYSTIEGNMAMNCTLPSPALGGRHSCTVKWKIDPQNKWCNANMDCVKAWADHKQVTKVIGYEAGEEYRRNKAYNTFDPKYKYEHPLIDWGWDREECIARIAEAGLPVPEKSSCIFCPMMKEWEVRGLTPAERGRVMRIEVYAEPYNTKVHGLWGKPRKRDGRPGSMTEFILNEGLEWVWPDDEMPMNINCSKRKRGYSMKPPHIDTSLTDMLKIRTGFTVPEQSLMEVEHDSNELLLNLK